MFRVSMSFNKQLNYELQTLYEKKKKFEIIVPQNVNSIKLKHEAKDISDNFNLHLILSAKIPADFDGVLWKEHTVLFLGLSNLSNSKNQEQVAKYKHPKDLLW